MDHVKYGAGLGKGGKGLGKGGAKRHRKVLRDNIQGIAKPAIRRLARRGGVKRLSGLIYEETRGVLKVYLENVIRDAVTYTEHARRKTVSAMDVVSALKRQGMTLYGFGSMEHSGVSSVPKKRTQKRQNAQTMHGDGNTQLLEGNTQPPPELESERAFKVIVACSKPKTGLVKDMLKELGSQNIFLDSAIDPLTIYIYLKQGFNIVNSPKLKDQNDKGAKDSFLSAEVYDVDAFLSLFEKVKKDIKNMNKDKALIAASLLTYAYGPQTIEMDSLPEDYKQIMDILKRIQKDKFKTILQKKTNILGTEENDTKSGANVYGEFFNYQLTLKYSGDSGAVNEANKVEEVDSNTGLPVPETALGSCSRTLKDLNDEDATYQEMQNAFQYNPNGTYAKVYANNTGFWVAVELL